MGNNGSVSASRQNSLQQSVFESSDSDTYYDAQSSQDFHSNGNTQVQQYSKQTVDESAGYEGIQRQMFIFGSKDSEKLFEIDGLLDNQSEFTRRIDEKHFIIDIRSNFNESNQASYESIYLFQTDRPTLFLFIIESSADGKIDIESIITFKILNDVYLFDTKSCLFVVNGSYANRNQDTIKSNIELLLDLEDIQVSFINSKSLDYFEVLNQSIRKCKPTVPTKQKEFSWTYPKIKELKDEFEQKPNCLSEIYYLNSLLKETDVKTEDKGDLLAFSYRNTQYFYDYKKSNLSCKNNQGIKLLDTKGLDILKYLLKREAVFRRSENIKNELDKGSLDKAITDFLKQTNEHTLETNDDETRRRMNEIDKMIFALEDESSENTNETKEKLEIELHNYEEHQSKLQNLENDIQKTKEQIQSLSKKVIDDDENEVMSKSYDKLDDFLQIKRFQFESNLNSQAIQSLKKMKKNQYEKTIQWNRFDRNREQKDVDVLTKDLRDEKAALNELESQLESKQKLQASLEKRNTCIEVTLIPDINDKIEKLKSKKSQYENRIKELKKKKEELEEEKLEKIRNKRTQDIFKDVGGSDRTIWYNDRGYRPHEKCVNFPKSGYTCHYIGAVREAVDFVSEKLELETIIDIEATKLQLLKKLSDERYEHSVGAIKDGKANGEHVEDLKTVVNKIVNRRDELREEATKIEAIELIKSTMKQKQALIHLLEKKISLANARVLFSKNYDSIKKKHDITKQIQSYEQFLNKVTESDEGSIFLRKEYLKQRKILEDYRSYLNDENQSTTLNSEINLITQKVSNIEYATDVSTENHQQKLERLKNDLYNLEQQKKKIEYHIQNENIVNKVEVIRLQLRYFESLPHINEIRARSILLNQSSQIDSRTHYGFDFRGKKYAHPLPDPNSNDIQLECIQRINRILNVVNLIDKQIVELKAERKKLSEQSKAVTDEQRSICFQNVERYLLDRSIRLSGFDRFYDGTILNSMESLISVLISELIDRPHLYEIDGNNCLDPLIEQGVMKILKILKNNHDIDTIISEINREYSDEGCLPRIRIFTDAKEIEYNRDISSTEVHNKKDLFLFKQNNLYFVLKHDQTIKLVDDENLNLKLHINRYVSDIAEYTDLLENLCRMRIKYHFKKYLEKSNSLIDVYQDEINQLGKIYSIREFNGEYSSYSNSTLFYFLSNLDEYLSRLELKLYKMDFEFEEILNSCLIKIKDLYKSAIIKVLYHEQERRKQIRQDKIRKNDRDENDLKISIEQDEEREKQLLEALNKKQEEIFKIEQDLNRIIDELNRSETTYRKVIEDLEKQRTNILDQLNKLNEELRQLSNNMIANEQEIRKLQCQIEELNNNLNRVNNEINKTEVELAKTITEKLNLVTEKVNLEVEKKKILIDKTSEENNLKEKQAEIDRNQAWIKFLENLNQALLSEEILQCKQKTLEEIKSTKTLEELYKKLINNNILNKFLFENLNRKDVDEYVRRAISLPEDENYNLFIKLKQTTNSFLCPINGQLISELGLDTDGKPIQVKKYKISANSSISYREIHQNLKDAIEREIKCQAGGLIFEQNCLKVKDNGINSLEDLPMEIKPLVIDRIKINYQQHEWNNRLNSKYEKAVEQLNQLKINYRDIVYCYVDQIEIQCCGTFLLDSNDYYPGIDLMIRARKMKCGKQRESVSVITTGSDAPEFVFSRASDGYQRRKHKNTPEGNSGLDGEFGRDGQHAGNIFIKIDETIECLELLKSIELCGGKGGVGQLGGNGDKGCKGKDGENGVADDTRGFGGGQTTFGFGQPGTKSGDGGNAGFSGRGGRAGQAGKLSISDSRGNLYELLKDRIRQNDGLPGRDPDLTSSSAPKGGEGGDPTIIGMDQVRNKRSFIRKTTTENGEVDIEYLLDKNPALRKEIEKNQKCGNRGVPEYVSIPFVLLAPILLAPLPLLIDGTIPYR
ncbi:unnamed protein product, partial [Rotaria magnacalcarata]